MVYVKDNVERIVTNIVDAKKLESEGFKRIDKTEIPPTDEKPVIDIPLQRGRKKKEV